jgi:hypothetical protein
MSDNKNQTRAFTGVFIPAYIWLHQELPLIKKCLLAEISSLDNDFGCTANNRHFCDFSGMETDTISKLIKSLEKDGWLTITYRDEKTREGRVIKVNKIKYQGLDILPPVLESTPPRQESTPPVSESEHKEHLNTIQNTLSIKEEILAKIQGFINNPMFEQYKETKFNLLDEKEIRTELAIYLSDYPKSANTGICNYLSEQNTKKAKQAKYKDKVNSNPTRKHYTPNKGIEWINPMRYNSEQEFLEAKEELQREGYEVKTDPINSLVEEKWRHNNPIKQQIREALGGRKFQIQRVESKNPVDLEIDLEKAKKEAMAKLMTI